VQDEKRSEGRNRRRREGHDFCGASSPTTSGEAIIAAGHQISDMRRSEPALRPPMKLPSTSPVPTMTSTHQMSAGAKPAIRSATGAI
jgi:hypothetical protein